MGLCASKNAENAKNRKIQRELADDMKKQDEIMKLLLLGAGESGKSTIFKQMKILYGKPWDKDEINAMKPVISSNIIQNLKSVIDYIKTNNISVENDALLTEISLKTDDSLIDAALGAKIKKVWEDPGVKNTWANRSKFQVLDCLEYYCNNIDRISSASFVPTEMDILQARVRTSGIVEEKYVIDGVQFSMFDVGGQRNERKKWIHCFDSVTAVIFVAALSEYDQVLYEDSQTNRIDEAIKLFEEICNSSWFRKTSMILFLNKKDLFAEKLFKIPFRVPGKRYDDFAGPYAEESNAPREDVIQAAQKYILNLFVSRKQQADKEVYSHVTCATDTKNVQVVFSACKDIILRRNLVNSGFMD